MDTDRWITFINDEIDELYLAELNNEIVKNDSMEAMRNLIDWYICRNK